MIKKVGILLGFLYLSIGCKQEKIKPIGNVSEFIVKKHPLNKEEFKNWHFKDIEIDTLPGISLRRTYDSLLTRKKGKEVIVAVIDMAVEIDHDGLQKYIWSNSDEISGNQKDDDGNGYIDDVHGWNFLSNQQGQNNEFVNYEYTRILRKYNPVFQGKTKEEIDLKDSLGFVIYQKAQKKHEKRMQYAQGDITYINDVAKSKSDVEKQLANYFKDKSYTIKDLDSLKKLYPSDKKLANAIDVKSFFIEYDYSNEYIADYKLKAKERVDKLLNLDFNDRKITGDNENDLNDNKYGSGSFKVNTTLLSHGTKMAGVIAHIGLKDEIKIMPLAVSAYGDEHDKDIALAIRYAVDNGAKVINMSFGKDFSLHPQWVFEALQYADKNNVIVVSSAGNSEYNLNNNQYYPNDNENNSPEVSDNFLLVGASSFTVDKNFKVKNSNYGSIDVDVFAPGRNIFTTYPNNKLDFVYSGTSLSSAVTSGVAALLYSYYSNLTASEVKHILMDSGLEYTIEVRMPNQKDKDKTLPFNRLSKSGRVINAYNALIMADSISKSK